MADEPNTPDPSDDAPATDGGAAGDATGGGDTVTISRSEWDGVRSELGRIRAERKRADEERAAEQGRWQEIAEARESELAELRASVARDRSTATIRQLAAEAGIVDPDVAIALLGDAIGGDDDGNVDAAAAKRALAELVKAKPYLAPAPEDPRTPRRTGAAAVGNGQGVDADPVEAHGAAILRIVEQRRAATGRAFPVTLD